MNAPSTTSTLEIREASDFAVLYVGAPGSGRAPVADRLSKSGLAVTRAGSLAEALAGAGLAEFRGLSGGFVRRPCRGIVDPGDSRPGAAGRGHRSH